MLIWHIGDVVRKVRETQGRQRKEVADAAGLLRNTYGNVERMSSNFTRDTIERITVALGYPTPDRLYAQIPHAPESCGLTVSSTVTLPDDDVSRALAALWPRLPSAVQHNILSLVRGLALAREKSTVTPKDEDADTDH